MNDSIITSWNPAISSCRILKRWKAVESRRSRKCLDGTVVVLALSVHIAAWGNCFYNDQESLQKTNFDESLQSLSNAHPAYCWVAYLLWQNCHCQELEHSQREESQCIDTLSGEIQLIFDWRETLSILEVFSNNTKLVNCKRKHSFSLCNDLSNVFRRRSKD